MVELTKDEAESLADFLEWYLIPAIQNEESDVDNIEWLCNMTAIYGKCREVLK